MADRLDPRLLDAALAAEPEAWRRVWGLAERATDRPLQDQLLAVACGPALRALIAPHLLARLTLVADAEGGTGERIRGKRARRLVELLLACELAPYVSRNRQWGDERVVHIGLCGAPSQMKLAPRSAAWDLVRGQLCRNCRRALEGSAR